MADKPLVFISHITEEKELAQAFKDMVEHAFLGLMEVFVSSDPESVPMGKRWLGEIEDALKRCAVEIVVCSPHSVTRPWIQFEAGAGWIRGIDVIPICHSGMTPSKLPIPLNLLQGATATDAGDVERVLAVLAKALGSKIPAADVAGFVAKATTFEKQYVLKNTAKSMTAAKKTAAKKAPAKQVAAKTKAPPARARSPMPVKLSSTPADCLALIETWLHGRGEWENVKPITYSVVDKKLKLEPGSAKKFIAQAASRWGLVARYQGEDVILFQKAPPVGGRGSGVYGGRR